MRGWSWVVAALAAMQFCVAEAAPKPLTIDYTLAPVMRGGTPRTLAVTLHFRGDERASLTLDLPDKSMGESDLWQHLSGFTVQGATMQVPDPAHRVLNFAPGSDVTVRYEVSGAYADNPEGSGGNPYRGVVLAKDWVAGIGNTLFAEPHDGELWPATFQWGPLPKGWAIASDLEHGAQGRAMTVTDIIESTLLGGSAVTVYRRPIPDGEMRFAVQGTWPFSTAQMADTLGRIVSAQRLFWGKDMHGPFLVTMFQLKGTGSSGGTGRGDAFALYATPDTAEASLLRTIAHEHTHSWIPSRIGQPPDGDAEALEYWLTEGFTDFYAERTMLKSGVWSLEQFVGDLNDKVLEYDTSPVRDAPNARIEKEFWSNYAIQQLPYERGMLFGYLIDARIRDASRGAANLDSVLFAMRDAYIAAPADGKPDPVKNFLASLHNITAIDIDDLMKSAIEAGTPITLPENLFGSCATIQTVRFATFDRGFDVDKTAATGHFAGVDPQGPAYAAGIRDGMVRAAWLGGRRGDSRIDWSYRVGDGQGKEWEVHYKPAGRAMVEVQAVQLAAGMTAEQRGVCARLLSGG